MAMLRQKIAARGRPALRRVVIFGSIVFGLVLGALVARYVGQIVGAALSQARKRATGNIWTAAGELTACKGAGQTLGQLHRMVEAAAAQRDYIEAARIHADAKRLQEHCPHARVPGGSRNATARGASLKDGNDDGEGDSAHDDDGDLGSDHSSHRAADARHPHDPD